MCRWHDLGYIASFITFCGASIFWISTITGVPGVLPNEATHIAEWDILFWFPQARPSPCLHGPALAACGTPAWCPADVSRPMGRCIC